MLRIDPNSSPVLALYTVVRDHANIVGPKHIEARYKAMSGVVSLAIETGMRFNPSDFRHIFSEHCHSRSNISGDGEWQYKLAVAAGNTSACVAMEIYKNRPAFFLGGKRMYVGRRFLWQGEMVECTSFRESVEGEVPCFTACSFNPPLHKDEAKYENCRRVWHRFTISLHALKAYDKSLRLPKPPKPEK